MVAINRFLVIVLFLFTGSALALAQQIEPRIDGLQADSVYMKLLVEDNRLTMQEDSIAVVVESLREIYRTNPTDTSGSREQIIALENQLFELRSRKAVVIDNLNLIEQEWVVNNMGRVVATEPEQAVLLENDVDVRFIYESPNVKVNLSDNDYKNLVKAENLESKVEALSNRYIINYDNMLSLSRSYELTSQQREAIKIRQEFDSLALLNVQTLEQLNDSWGFIYDNKSFAYSMLMELLGFDEVLSQEAELMRSGQSEISAKQGGGADALLEYMVQKNSMVQFETLVAERLELASVADSLKVLARKLSAVNKVSPPKLTIEERLFILYEPIEFVTKPLYTASNPIPETVIYDKGVIFRLYVGSFQAKQTVATFRNTTPLSHAINDKNRHCYYIGGFETYEEAEEAQALLKKRGFRAPQIVVWLDGRERNLTTDPIPMSTSYRLEVSQASSLPADANKVVAAIAPSSSISKVGTDIYVIMPLSRQGQADSLAMQLGQLDPMLKIEVHKTETEIEF